MNSVGTLREHPIAIRGAAVAGAFALAGLLALLRESVSQSTAAIILVLAVVAAAATGDRWSGVGAALAAAAGFDFFLVTPYLSFTIAERDGIEMATALMLVGLAVTEIALWGRRHQAAALRRDGYLEAMLRLLDIGPDPSGRTLQRAIAEAITEVLDADRTVFAEGAPRADDVVVADDGSVRQSGRVQPVRRDGLPVHTYTVIPVHQGDARFGHFRVTTSTSIRRPRTDQLRAAVLLANQLREARVVGDRER